MQGIRAARYEWLASDGGSIFSIAGNLLIPFSYVGLFLVITNSSQSRFRFVLLGVFLFFVVIFGHAALNGGRSNVLLALIMIVLAFSLRPEKVPLKLFFKVSLCSLLVIVPSYFYVSEVIRSSASMGGVNLGVLLTRAIDGLEGQFVQGYSADSASEFEIFIIYIFSYLVHGQWTAQAISNLNQLPGSYFLYPFSVMLARLGLIHEPLSQGAFADVGAFVSLPSAIYYDFGFAGLAFFSSLIGACFGLGLYFLRSRSTITGWKLGLFVYFSFIVVLSPVLPAYGFSYLNFIVFAFFVVGFINRLVFGKRYRLI